MDKKASKANKIRLLIYSLVVGIFTVVGVGIFVLSQFNKAKYDSSRDQLDLAQTNLETALALPDGYRKTKEVEWYTDVVNYLTVEYKKNSNNYKASAYVSYISTTLALVSFGVCLKIEDNFKSKEE